jgi:hypothetical protein
MKKRRSSSRSYWTTLKTWTNAGKLSAWSRPFSVRWRSRLDRARLGLQARLLAKAAGHLGVLPLLIEIVRIERGLQPGSWLADETGRLWVWLE